MKFLLYIFNPEKTVEQFLKYSLKTIFVDTVFLSLFIIIVTIIFRWISFNYNIEITRIWFPEKNIPYLLIGVVLAPILEEFTFRSPLRFTKASLWFFCVGYIYFGTRFLYKSFSIYGTIGILSLTLVLFLLYKYRIHKTHFKLNIIVYTSTLLFGLVHLQNLDFDHTSVLGAVVYVFPIFFGGLVLSYIRLKYSLLAAIIFHSLHNLVAYVLFYFS